MAGASMKDIKLRIKSVESTMQITKAMELVASSKLRRAKERVEKSRPYFEVLHAALSDIAASNAELSSPYIARRLVKKTCYVVIAGDRGLAGGYNANILKAVAAEAEGKEICVLPVGKKALEHYQRRGVERITEQYAEAADVTVSDCFSMAQLLAKGFLAGEYDEIRLAYTNFVSMLSQQPATLCLLPLDVSRPEPGAGPRGLTLYEPSSEEVYDAIVPEYLAGLIYGALCESVASELGARRSAMDAATKNAGEMIDSLSLHYNRARQAAITQEITEIVAGAEA
ncbi:ATP synthase F1 subunit gamma [Allofournierella massiliensis]|uniref:ATP synthase gamma chain n=1 Tax=Allofournierella massiliensis TaxID=1650663 RepID=A0A4R1QUF9_9FIRM|nr:ATP synthase F1 subunit gamma [Fournierella massiliensis]TCL56135.1 F-type H+-transporting ATPase subunit gamma [Fournierella massiliensis]